MFAATAFAALGFPPVVEWFVQLPSGESLPRARTEWFCGALLLISGWMLALRVRVDESGVTWSRGLLIDTWTWTDFRSGRIIAEPGGGYLDPGRPWWRKRLPIAWLDKADASAVIARIETHHVPPPAPPTPSTLTIRTGDGCEARCSSSEVLYRRRGVERRVRWQDVRGLWLLRASAGRRGYRLAILSLPDRQLVLGHSRRLSRCRPDGAGESAEAAADFLLRHVPPDRVQVSIDGEPVTNRPAIEWLVEQLERRARGGWLMSFVIAFSFAAGSIMMIASLFGTESPSAASVILTGTYNI
ncbi:MAG: hypothetical protein IPM64_01690 [Phycisphaerales bacterium]|nr:hypothetical protein [Phycisphaerales bacterium]